MFGAEHQVLKIVRELNMAGEEAITRKMAVSKKYVAEICAGLLEDGYLLKTPKGYKLAGEGEKAVSPVKVRGIIPVLRGGIT